ncbi:AGAP009214-PA-like protein [Anopheles sinensis]|uniref:AGAP009214-PA-like protein n=1 Tax=Anopheles sinensis TaxID=74873 RepID=A0A084WQL5_ANOSI|nr:AGAP009214-PA-like protein [Anopheles sinensis]
MALLYYQEGWRCAGTLINERYILTAAHCVKNVKLNFVRLGEFDLSLRIDCDQWGWGCAPAPQDIPIDRVIIHKKYNSRRKQNDIALLRLAHPVTLNKNVMPICLPVTPQLRENEQWYKVFGWGRTEKDMSGKLRGAEVNLLLQDACNKWIAQVDKYIRNTNTQVCAIGAANMSEHCRGDSGGPLLTRTSTGRYVQYGVVSYGLYSCGKEPFPETYTRVASFIDWIFDNLEE